ncbi:MAG: DUF1844 domain-containing protein [Deinococcota bacterium]
MSDPRFIGLVQSIVSSAQAALGDDSSPLSQRLAQGGALQRSTAQKSMELLEMLQQKTLGNLDETERDVLHQALIGIRTLLTPDTLN